MVTVYAHCGEFYVEPGDTVDRNTPIAAIGMTGTTTGPHVHFEIRIDGEAVNHWIICNILYAVLIIFVSLLLLGQPIWAVLLHIFAN